MTRSEAQSEAERLNKLDNCRAQIVRILPQDIDPIQPGDNGWDVEVEITGHGTG